MKRIILLITIIALIIVLPIVLSLYLIKSNFESEGYAGTVKGGEQNIGSKHIQVYTAKDLQEAINQKENVVIEIMNDLDLGYYNIQNEIGTSDTIKEHKKPQTHPILKKTGVSKVILSDMSNVTIYSKNNAKILHASLELQNVYNVDIHNLMFDELWEWDDSGKYDKNDWDYITVVSAEKLWIHNCIFGQSYDGIIDIKNGKSITISYCKIEPNNNKQFIQSQFDYLEENKDSFVTYNNLRTQFQYTKEDIQTAFDNQYKAFNFGTIEGNEGNKNITVTMHHNYFKNVKSRTPRLREGKLHFYCNTVDNSELENAKAQVDSILVSTRGLIITENGQALVENCLFINVMDPFRINASDSGDIQKDGKMKIINCQVKYNGKIEKIEEQDIGKMDIFNILESILYKYSTEN